MSNAAKHRKKAAEFEQLKQIDRAIAAYIKAVEESEREGADVDVALLNKVGDLTLRQGRVADAVTYYERAVEHYATAGLFNNAIALCNKILRSAPGRSNVYFTLGRICAKKGLRGDATRNFLEYATRMQQEGRVEEGMRALAEVADLMPELTEVRRLVEEHAIRAGIVLPRRKTPSSTPATDAERPAPRFDNKSSELVFLDLGSSGYTRRNTPPLAPRIQTPARSVPAASGPRSKTPISPTSGANRIVSLQTQSLDDFILFDPNRPTPTEPLRALTPIESLAIDVSDQVIKTPVEATFEASAEPAVGPDAEPTLVELAVETVEDMSVETSFETSIDASIDTPVDVSTEIVVEALAETLLVEAPVIEVLDGLTSDEFNATLSTDDIAPEVTLSWLTPPEIIDNTPSIVEEELEIEGRVGEVHAVVVADLIIEDFDHVADDPQAVVVTGTTAGTPTYNADLPASLTPIDVSPVPELDAAIEAGAHAVAMAESEPEPAPRTPPFRLDPHDFILPGELPPLIVEDELVFAGMQFAIDAVDDALTSTSDTADVAEFVSAPADDSWSAVEAPDVGAIATAYETSIYGAAEVIAPEESSDQEANEPSGEQAVGASVATPVEPVDASVDADDLAAESLLRETIEASRAVRSTPSLHIAAVAAEANAVATSRREELRAAVLHAPHDWVLRRRLAEALFEVGEREAGLSELQAAVSGFAQRGDLAAAADVADELVRIASDRISYHQKRVELAVRLADQQRLRAAYLDLADTLVRMGDDGRAHAVYARVLEIDPWDERARTALGGAAPPPPTQPDAAPDDFVNLAEWLQDDGPGTTRMRMREPQVSGDEQADFDTLLRHFKEGVARSLGEEDFESHYDLGVAYKEMGLLDDAISEFQKALRSRRHRLPAYEALGQCFVEQSRHAVAATVLSRAIHEPGPGDDHRVGVLYLLAYSCEALQRWDEARSYYSRVYATDIHFRDVAARMAALELIAR